ncbi:aldehyde dehydrogenase family protein [Escherichia coli]|nr:aldehyde dehydrogenase family protein [Escherichia coli]NYY74162.1 hypothetical protein [Escherichia coli]
MGTALRGRDYSKRSSRENILLFKRALGVTTGILPWNFPFFLIARKMAPAL